MSDPRWTNATRDLVARAACTQDALDAMCDDPREGRTEDDRDDWRRIAEAALAALADAGLLLPPDAEANRQYGRLLLSGRVIPSAGPDPTHYRLVGPWRAVDS